MEIGNGYRHWIYTLDTWHFLHYFSGISMLEIKAGYRQWIWVYPCWESRLGIKHTKG